MLRVSSRQRLVSWDAFDASAPEEDPDDGDFIMMLGGHGSSNAGSNASANIVVDALSGALAVHNDGSNNDDVVVVGNVNNNGDDDEDADSIADYESCCYDSTSRRGSAVSSGWVPPVPSSTGWSFDLDGTADADSSAFPPPPPSPSSAVAVVVGKKRDRDYEQSSSDATTTTTTTSVGGGMKKTVSFSTLPPFPILEVPPHQQETTSSGSFLPTLIVPPSPPASSPISAGRSKIALTSGNNNVPEDSNQQMQMGGRVSSDVSLCRYLSVQSLCDMASFSSYVPSPTSSSSSPPHLVNLVDDALYSVASHLDPCDVRSLSASCRELRTLLTDRGAGHLWLGLGSRRWPVVRALTDQGKDDGNKRIEFRDGLGVPIAGGMVANNATDDKSSPTNDDANSDSSDRHDGGGGGGSVVVNMSALVGLTAPSQPTEIRPQSRTTLPSAASSSRRTRAAFRAGHHADYFRRFEMTTTTGGRGGDSRAAARAGASRAAAQVRPVVQYTGRVGDGDRSLTADEPLPRPTTVAPVADPVIITPPSDSEGDKSGGSSSSTRSGRSSRTSSSSVLPIPKKWSPRLSPLPSFHGGLGGPSPASLIDLLRRRRSSSSSVGGGGLSRSSSSVSTQGSGGSGGGNGEEESSGGDSSTTTTTKRPFVSPFVVEEREDGHGQQQQPVVVVDVTPRLVSYYEVTVLPRDVGQEPPLVGGNEEENGNGTARGTAAAAAASRHQRRRQQPGRGVLGGPEMPPLRLPAAAAGAAAAAPGFPLPNPHHLPHPRNEDGDDNTDPSDCVAVGLSTSSFAPAAKMPGWDGHSYGYHGDDGGTFHGAGDMERVFGPTYGVGDTVGCGVDYAYNDGRGAIFFTLNGKFLGYAWTDVPAVRDGEELYPTVGVDTNCPLSVNFGDVPFEFDLAGFADGQREAVEGRLGSGLVRRRAEERRRREEEEAAAAAAAAAATAAGKAKAVELTPSTVVDDVLDSRKIDEWGRGITSPPLSSVRGGVGVGGASVGAMRRTRMFRGMS